MPEKSLRVLFRAAAGPRVGFGHLIRCRSLARALGITPLVSLRATERTRELAGRLGIQLVADENATIGQDRPSVIVVDDPSAEDARIWVNRARRHGLPVATIHDAGLAYVASDLRIDGSIRPSRRRSGRQADLRGPAYAMLDPSVLRGRQRRAATGRPRVLIALGGGTHVIPLAASLADAIVARQPAVEVRIAAGFSGRDRTTRLAAGRWITVLDGLAGELSTAAVALVAGGVTLYEACAIGVPVVAAALTPAQALTVRAIARHGAAIDAGVAAADEASVHRIATKMAHLLIDAAAQRRMAAAGRALVDGRGVFRVADRLRQLVRQQKTGRRHAA